MFPNGRKFKIDSKTYKHFCFMNLHQMQLPDCKIGRSGCQRVFNRQKFGC